MIRLDGISKQHGGRILFLEASMSLFRGERVGLVGPNGAGKSTIFRLITGEDEPDSGSVVLERNVVVGHFGQNVGEMRGRTVLEETIAGAGEVADLAHELHELEHAMADLARADDMDRLVARFGDVQSRFDELDGYGLEARAREILAGLGFVREAIDRDVGELSGGWKMRAALARILLLQPDALLLDEPTNHLDIESIVWLERFLHDFEGALVVTSHDREFLNRLVTRIVEIDGGELTSFTGDYDFYERQRAMLAKEEAFIARFKARASHAAQVQSRVKKLEKVDRVEPPRRRQVVRFDFPTPPRSGDDVVKLECVTKGWGARPIYADFDFVVRRRERWCVMGVNGAGKTTLLKLIAGVERPDAGSVMLGANVRLGYFAQHAMELLEPKRTVMESLEAEHPRATLGALRTLAGAFGFSGDDVDKPCRVLSGGETARLVLAKMLYDPPNLLVLDEPTNHLDLATKAMLTAALADFDGTMVFVSHDRRVLRGLSTSVLELGGPDGPRRYDGGYAEYVAQTGYEAPGLR